MFAAFLLLDNKLTALEQVNILEKSRTSEAIAFLTVMLSFYHLFKKNKR